MLFKIVIIIQDLLRPLNHRKERDVLIKLFQINLEKSRMKIMSKLKTDNDTNNSLKDLIDYYNYYEIKKIQMKILKIKERKIKILH